jgi:hypothetical protein
MSSPKRDVDKVLYFRSDISPFLVHLTRNVANGEVNDKHDWTSKKNLTNILTNFVLKYGNNGISDARFGYNQDDISSQIKQQFFSAVSFTETPINEIHTLLEITKREINLRPYGLVFLKDKLQKKGVSPVMYINNFNIDKKDVAEALCSLISTKPLAAAKILPYISVFGKKLLPVRGSGGNHEDIDFTWEREWRYSSPTNSFNFSKEDVFIGLCPHSEIDYFEHKFKTAFQLTVKESEGDDVVDKTYLLRFIDPQRNIKWYADKLVDARQRVNLKYSVV